ncbi:MAG: YraN family protein [Lachnospiraceae bacterium]|nr:YraN family protein [Lachnospiraceae bacterium]
MNINKRSTGTEKETLAADYLRENGLEILETNFRCRIGEIDIIAKDKEYIVFTEVKFRKTASKGFASEAVDFKKIKKICKVSDFYRLINHLDESVPVRFDVIAITGEETLWYKNAFEYVN